MKGVQSPELLLIEYQPEIRGNCHVRRSKSDPQLLRLRERDNACPLCMISFVERLLLREGFLPYPAVACKASFLVEVGLKSARSHLPRHPAALRWRLSASGVTQNMPLARGCSRGSPSSIIHTTFRSKAVIAYWSSILKAFLHYAEDILLQFPR